MKLVRRQVEEMLAQDERCRNDDRYLYVRVLETCYDAPPSLTLGEWVALACPDYESVRRSRNVIQSEGRYPPTDARVAERRGRSMVTGEHIPNTGREAEVRDELGYAVPTGEHLFGGDDVGDEIEGH